YKPTLVFTKSGDNLVASARSVKGFDVYAALEKCSEYMVQFGGHMYAAGLTIKQNDFLLFKQKFNNVVQESITKEQLQPEIEIDAVVDFNMLDDKMLRILKQFEPHGPGNMLPIFLTKKVYDTGYAQCMGKANEHLRMYIKQQNAKPISAIAFGKGYLLNKTRNLQLFDVVYTISENQWKDNVTVQLHVKDFSINDD